MAEFEEFAEDSQNSLPSLNNSNFGMEEGGGDEEVSGFGFAPSAATTDFPFGGNSPVGSEANFGGDINFQDGSGLPPHPDGLGTLSPTNGSASPLSPLSPTLPPSPPQRTNRQHAGTSGEQQTPLQQIESKLYSP